MLRRHLNTELSCSLSCGYVRASTVWGLWGRVCFFPLFWVFCWLAFFVSPVLEEVGKEGLKKTVSNLLIVNVHQEIKAFLLKTNREIMVLEKKNFRNQYANKSKNSHQVEPCYCSLVVQNWAISPSIIFPRGGVKDYIRCNFLCIMS